MAAVTGPSPPAAAVIEPKAPNHGCLDSAPMKLPQLCTCNLQVDFPTEELAKIVLVTLSVDPELKPDNVWREMVVDGRKLVIKLTATEARFLRASFSAFMDLLVLTTRTIEKFGPGTEYMPK